MSENKASPKTIKELCEERGLDEETAYLVSCIVQRLAYEEEG